MVTHAGSKLAGRGASWAAPYWSCDPVLLVAAARRETLKYIQRYQTVAQSNDGENYGSEKWDQNS